MPQVRDYKLGRLLDHSHQRQNNELYLLKAGDTATGTIYFPITTVQGNVFIDVVNAGDTFIDSERVLMWRRILMNFGG